MPSIGDKLLTPKEVAALFRVDPKTVVRWGNAGHLPAIRTPSGKLLRFRLSDVEAALQAVA
ncbi:helix-turn-helix domain-containing protein [Bailinhaonella thermotolerans]|uniref:Helix-turn-helix domain-containing protein n=1 Tax=Bailinhaonella thermotolerans TaxID=1070861 RepID=A0A3A4AMC6_9ACTN|nr:helix-turn-helix domain-containing protein [Bailinhaonella thermotolerans]RJL20208.1 helix-turn-helix domain-containing protein [Bailinhaonella thermotolerans]